MAGKDPYSSSKSCQDIVTQSYNFSYFKNKINKSIGIARIGNVIGGGDWSPNRLFPDIFKKHPNYCYTKYEPMSGEEIRSIRKEIYKTPRT